MNLKSISLTSILALGAIFNQKNAQAQTPTFNIAITNPSFYPLEITNNLNSLNDHNVNKIHTYTDKMTFNMNGLPVASIVNGHAWSYEFNYNNLGVAPQSGFALNCKINNIEYRGYFELPGNTNSLEIGTIKYLGEDCIIASYVSNQQVQYSIYSFQIIGTDIIISEIFNNVIGVQTSTSTYVRLDTHTMKFAGILFHNDNELQAHHIISDGNTLFEDDFYFNQNFYNDFVERYDIAISEVNGTVYSTVAALNPNGGIEVLETKFEDPIFNPQTQNYSSLYNSIIRKTDFIDLDCPDYSNLRRFAFVCNNTDDGEVSVQTYVNGNDYLFCTSNGYNFSNYDYVYGKTIAYDPDNKFIHVGMNYHNHQTDEAYFIATARYEDGTIAPFLNNTYHYMFIHNPTPNYTRHHSVSFNQGNNFNREMYTAYYTLDPNSNEYGIAYKYKDSYIGNFKKQIPLANSWSVYPNPFNQSFTLNGGAENGKYHYSLNNILGQTILNYQGDNQGFNEQVSIISNSLPAGTYLLNVQNKDEQQSFKLIKQ